MRRAAALKALHFEPRDASRATVVRKQRGVVSKQRFAGGDARIGGIFGGSWDGTIAAESLSGSQEFGRTSMMVKKLAWSVRSLFVAGALVSLVACTFEQQREG